MASAMGEVITISNFATKMAPITSESGPDLFALVDMGSNGIRFSISDLAPPTSRLLPCIYKERAGISLYDALHENTPGSKPFYFSQKTIDTVASKLAHFSSLCKKYKVPPSQIQVFATEAMRTSQNREDILTVIKQKSGMTVDILAPETESLFGSLGARSGFEHVEGLFMDLGGGSVQMTWLDSRQEGYEVLAAQAAKSMPYGAARLSEALQSKDAKQTVQTLKNMMMDTFQGMCERFPVLKQKANGEGVKIYFCGGGFRGYGSMLMDTHPVQPYPIPAIGGFVAEGKHFKDYKGMLKENSKEGKVFGMSKRRREQFPAIATVVEALVGAVPNIKDVTFCSGGNREGVLFMKLDDKTRNSNPLESLAASDPIVIESKTQHPLSTTLNSLLPTTLPYLFSPAVLDYLLCSSFTNQGLGDDSNSAYSIHHAISGSISTIPGLTHQIRALISLTMCARWGTDLGPMDQLLLKQLQKLVGYELAWWCQYVGATLRFLLNLYPIIESEFTPGNLTLRCQAKWYDSGLGKKGKKSGIIVSAKRGEEDVEDALSVFDNVGKGLDIEWKVQSEIV